MPILSVQPLGRARHDTRRAARSRRGGRRGHALPLLPSASRDLGYRTAGECDGPRGHRGGLSTPPRRDPDGCRDARDERHRGDPHPQGGPSHEPVPRRRGDGVRHEVVRRGARRGVRRLLRQAVRSVRARARPARAPVARRSRSSRALPPGHREALQPAGGEFTRKQWLARYRGADACTSRGATRWSSCATVACGSSLSLQLEEGADAADEGAKVARSPDANRRAGEGPRRRPRRRTCGGSCSSSSGAPYIVEFLDDGYAALDRVRSVAPRRARRRGHDPAARRARALPAAQGRLLHRAGAGPASSACSRRASAHGSRAPTPSSASLSRRRASSPPLLAMMEPGSNGRAAAAKRGERERAKSESAPGIAQADEILGGGFPSNSINIVMGQPGTGKSIFAEQLVFRNASDDRPILYLTTLSEPLAKMVNVPPALCLLRRGQDRQVGRSSRTSDPSSSRGASARCSSYVQQAIEASSPKMIVIDSFRALHDLSPSPLELRHVLYELTGPAHRLPDHGVPRRRVHRRRRAAPPRVCGRRRDRPVPAKPAEHAGRTLPARPQAARERVPRRSARVPHRRGRASRSSRASSARRSRRVHHPRGEDPDRASRGSTRSSEGASGAGARRVLAGPTGAGKTTAGLQFVLEGVRRGEPCLYANFQENPMQLASLPAGSRRRRRGREAPRAAPDVRVAGRAPGRPDHRQPVPADSALGDPPGRHRRGRRAGQRRERPAATARLPLCPRPAFHRPGSDQHADVRDHGRRRPTRGSRPTASAGVFRTCPTTSSSCRRRKATGSRSSRRGRRCTISAATSWRSRARACGSRTPSRGPEVRRATATGDASGE